MIIYLPNEKYRLSFERRYFFYSELKILFQIFNILCFKLCRNIADIIAFKLNIGGAFNIEARFLAFFKSIIDNFYILMNCSAVYKVFGFNKNSVFSAIIENIISYGNITAGSALIPASGVVGKKNSAHCIAYKAVIFNYHLTPCREKQSACDYSCICISAENDIGASRNVLDYSAALRLFCIFNS